MVGGRSRQRTVMVDAIYRDPGMWLEVGETVRLYDGCNVSGARMWLEVGTD